VDGRRARVVKSFTDDWRGNWLSLFCAVAVLLVFSQAWQAPLFGYTTGNTEAGMLIRNFYYPFYLLGFVLCAICWRPLLDATWRTALLMALLTLCCVSVLWSIDPSGTIRRCVAMLVTVLCGYAIAARFSWKRLSEVLAITFTIAMVASYVLALFVPQMGRMQELFPGAWRGVWLEKNNLGAIMAIGFVSSIAASMHNPSRRVFWWGIAAAMVFLVIMSQSKTALVSLLLGGAGIVFVYLTQRGPVLGILLTWLAVTVLLCLAGFMWFAPEKIFLLLGKDPTLTGRTFIWDGIERVIRARPLLGYGYGVVWTDESAYAPLAKITQVAGFRAYHAHSCWFEVWLGLGAVGLVLWACVFAEAWAKGLWRTWRGDSGYFALPMLAIYSLSSITESMALGWNDLRWALFVMVLVKLSLPGDKDSTQVLTTSDKAETA
jgi:exopolysaccharide production protein ExoQ